MNDSPVGCQSRDLTEPAGEKLSRPAQQGETEGLSPPQGGAAFAEGGAEAL